MPYHGDAGQGTRRRPDGAPIPSFNSQFDMHEFYNRTLIVFLCMLAASALLVFFCIDLSHVSASLQDLEERDISWQIRPDTDAMEHGKSVLEIRETSPALRLAFTVSPLAPHPHAAVDMVFDDGDGKQVLRDLTAYATASFIVKCVPANTLTLTVPTFDPTVSQRGDILSYRIVSAFFKCNEKPSRVVIDLTRMETQQWWFDMFKMDLSRHHYRLDQVPKFAFGTTAQSPMDTHSEVDIRELQLNGRDYRYPIGAAFVLAIAWTIFGVWFFRAHTRALVADLNSRMHRDLPLIAYQQLSMEPHRDKEKAAILRHMAMHYTNPDIDVETMAKEVGVTRGKINDVLKNEFGFTFSGYLNKLRLTEAARLLAEKDSATVAEIAYSVGYGNVSYFNKLFKEEYGSTPKAFRAVACASEQPIL
jgi:AraC-like DNA-binding protein